jgi:hypothetical protein
VDRCALFVDAGYVLADGAMAVHGTRQRGSVSWDYAGLVKLLTGLSRDRTGLPVLRCYWYEAVEGRRNAEHETLADLPGLKLRLGRIRPGRREGVQAELHRDLATLARNRAVSDAVIVSAEDDLAEIITEVQDLGLRVVIVHIPVDGNWTISGPLREECDDVVEVSGAHLRPFVDLIAGAEPAERDEQYSNGSYAAHGYQRRALNNGHGGGIGAVTHQGLPAAALPAPPTIYTTPVVEQYQRSVQPAGSGGIGAGSVGVDRVSADVAGPSSPGSTQPPASAAPQSRPPALPPSALPPSTFPSPTPSAQVPQAQAQAQAQAPATPQPAADAVAPARQSGPSLQADSVHQAVLTAQAVPSAQAAPAQIGAAPQAGPLGQAVPSQEAGLSAQVVPSPQASQPLQGGFSAQFGPSHQPALPAQPGPPAHLGLPGHAAHSHEGAPSNRDALTGEHVAQHGSHALAAAQTGEPPQDGARNVLGSQDIPGSGRQGSHASQPMPQTPLPSPVPQSPGLGDVPFGQGQAAYRAPDQLGQRSGLPVREPSALREGLPGEPVRSPGPAAARFADVSVPAPPLAHPGQPEPMPPQQGPAQPMPSAQPMPGHQYLSAPPGQFGGVGPGPMPQPAQFPGSGPGQPTNVMGSGYPGPQHDQGPYSGPQSAAHAQVPQPVPEPMTVSLTDAVQAAHAEGFGFGEAVARDAPALWLEAVLARKPRMPSDLEARLLQGSALPIDSLLHDEVRHSLRRGFWDALERSRR